jgi:hypothetical protein
MKQITAAFTSLLTAVALAPYEMEVIGTLIPPGWKAGVGMAAAIATLLLRAGGQVMPPKR